MSRTTVRWAAIIQICLVLTTGCTPTQPFFVPRDASLAHFLDQSLDIQYADVHVESLPEAVNAAAPLGPDNLPSEFIDLTLEDCISIALQNSKILRVIPGSNLQTGSVSAALLSAQPGQMPSIYDPALTATTANTQPLAVDNQGNRFNPRGATRANQVGGVEDALSEFDAQFSAILGYNTTDRPRNVGRDNVFNPQFFQGVDSNAQTALSKRMATGTIATARFTTVYSRNNVPASGNAANSNFFGRAVPSDYTATVELSFIQPLLRGRGTLVNRIPVVLARINEDIQLHEFEANVRNLVKAVEDAYWDLYVGYRAFEAAKEARESALDLWRVALQRTRLTNTPPEAEAQARALLWRFENQLKTALNGLTTQGFDPRGLYGREQILRERMGWAATDQRLIRPIDDPTVARVEFGWHDVLAEGLTRNVDLRRQKWAIKQAELELISAKNQMLPQLDLNATYRFLGVGDDFANADRGSANFPNPGSSALEELTEGNYQEVGARLEYQPQPFGKRRALAGIRNTQLRIAKAHEELREKEMAFVQELSFAVRNKQSAFVAMQDLSNEWTAYDQQINIYKDKILAGQADIQLDQLVDILVRTEELRSRAQQAYFQTVAEYNKAMVNIHYLKGSLLDLNSISLGEGAWVEKAYWDAEERARERASGIYFDYGFTRPGVVTRGQVPMGGVTEGNISDKGMSLQETRATTDDDESDDNGDAGRQNNDLRPLPALNPPTASSNPARINSQRRAAPVVPASSTSEAFDWSGLGLESPTQVTEPNRINDRGATYQKPQTRPTTVVNTNQRPIRVIGTGNQPQETQASAWQPR
jgi:outer membrane protein TolC